jgi:lysophospholipase L1-like esterase
LIAKALQFSGLKVIPTNPASMQVIVETGSLKTSSTLIKVSEAKHISIRLAGERRYTKQVYQITGVGTKSPCGWNGESIRGSGGRPYQRMVPGSLKVYSKDRQTLYRSEEDYVQDSYWGTIKRHPEGTISDGEELSLDYAVWLCRYDAIVLMEDGSIHVVEGDSEAPESRELLLPEPPVVKNGYVLAHVFTGWGQTTIYGGGSYVETTISQSGAPIPQLRGRYMDMVARSYVVDCKDNSPQSQLEVQIAATGEDYGTSHVLSLETVRWTDPKIIEREEKLPLVLKSAYHSEIDWGLELDLSLASLTAIMDAPRRHQYIVHAIPEMIMDMRPLHAGRNPIDLIPLDQTEHLHGIKQQLASGKSVRIAFFGESTTRSGLWPYQVISGLRQAYPDTKIYSSNVAIGGEGTRRGIHRLDHEVLSTQPDLIMLEYLINDACSGDPVAIDKTVRSILERIREAGIPCVIITNNGMNPVFSPYGSLRNFLMYHDMYRRLAAEFNVAFVGGFAYFAQLHQFGKYFLTELKGNMVNHPYGNEDLNWGPFDRILSTAILQGFVSKYDPK